MKVTVLPNGTIDMHAGTFLKDTPEKERDRIIPSPVSMYLIETEGKKILFDTGNEGLGNFEGPGLYIPEDQRLEWYLKKLNLRPTDIDYVICSHLHIDHTGSLHKYSGSEIIVHCLEYQFAKETADSGAENMLYPSSLLNKWKDANLSWNLVSGECRILPFLENLDILALGPGHSAGMLGLRIHTDSGNKLLISDAAYCKENLYPQIRFPGIVFDEDGYRNTLEFIRRLQEKDQAEIWYGHDAASFAEMRHFPGTY